LSPEHIGHEVMMVMSVSVSSLTITSGLFFLYKTVAVQKYVLHNAKK